MQANWNTDALSIVHVDVFCAADFYGNPLAVVVLPPDSPWPEAGFMQRVANWLNLSETTFAMAHPSGVSYQVRIFTPSRELAFAGHPSLGTACALTSLGLLHGQQLTQHCGAGALPVWQNGSAADSQWFVQAPTALPYALSAAAIVELADICGLNYAPSAPLPAIIHNGPRWAVAEFSDASALLAATPNFAALRAWNVAHNNLGLAGFARRSVQGVESLEVRCFVPLDGIPEDPVTGSGQAAIGAFLHLHNAFGDLPRDYQARQGRAMGRDGSVSVSVSTHGAVAIGGQVRMIARGTLLAELPRVEHRN